MHSSLGRTCGECTACCRTHAVFQIGKPAGVWCEHCRQEKGCLIYPDRPDGCRSFQCEWLKGEVPDEWFPLQSGVVLDRVISPAVGDLLQVWEAAAGSINLRDPAVLAQIHSLRTQISVAYIFLAGQKVLLMKYRN